MVNKSLSIGSRRRRRLRAATSNTSVTKGISSIAELLGKLAGLLVGLSALAYFVGYRIESYYFSEAGASWALGLLSPSELIQDGQGVIFAVGISFFVSVMGLMDRETTSEKLRRKDLWLSLIAIVLLIAAYATSKYWGYHKLDYSLSVVAGLVSALAAGFTIGELVARLDESGHKWEGYHVKLILFFYFSALATAPYYIGTNKAKLDLEPGATWLPVAIIPGEANETWRVMRTVGDKYLLVNLSEDPGLRKFRLAEVSSGVVVISTKVKPQ